MQAANMSNVTMMMDTPHFLDLSSETRDYSPIVLNRSWSELARLMVATFCTIFGLTMNGFFVSTFMIEKDLRKIGNVFLCYAGVWDIAIIGGVILPAAVIIISGNIWDTPQVCHGIQTLVTTATYCYSILFCMVSRVAWGRVIQTEKIFRKYLKIITGTICFLVFLVSLTLAIIGVYFEMDYDYCERKHHGNDIFRKITNAIHVLTAIITESTFIASYLKLERRNKGNGRYRRSWQYQRDVKMIKVNFAVHMLYVVSWAPYLVVLNVYPDAPDWVFYQTAALGVGRALLSSVFYGFLVNIFGKAYSNLFYYCWCKSSLKSIRTRHKRADNGTLARNVLEIRTHILQQAVNQAGPQQDL